MIFTSDGSGLRFFGLGRARALRFRARVGLGPGPIMKLLVGRARAFHFRARAWVQQYKIVTLSSVLGY